MRQTHARRGAVLAATFGLLAVSPAWAAQLTKVTADWKGGANFASDVSMYIYVPDKVATNPPILTLIHYCGGSASAVFGQASTVIQVVNQNGIIVVAPDNNARCWDVQTTKGLTRDSGGDAHAIAQMVKYAIATYKANPDRVYSTGDSSGGMTTQLLLALYPDIFKGGASFAGIPAGCRSGNETGNGYSGSCAGGSITHTAQEWGDIVRKMDPGYSGHRPRVQLFHGDKDQYIDYRVHAEAIKEWSNVLGLDATKPTSTTTVTLGTHQATRQSWKNECGFVVLDAFLSIGGNHGPDDCLFNSYVPPFLGLDKTGAVDPEIEQCGSGGAGGTSGNGGSTGAGGAAGSSGTSGGRDGGPGGSRDGGGAGGGGIVAAGGAIGNGGSTGPGGSNGSGGSIAAGGNPGAGGSAKGGASASAGGSANGGSGGTTGAGGSGKGGTPGSGGSSASSEGKGGASSPGNGGSGASTTVASTSGSGGNPGSGGSTATADGGSEGCGCALGGAPSKAQAYAGVGLGLALLVLARRRRRSA
jgi:acetylxylan esterase